MADCGIIFSAPMVRALLEGRKKQTRRLCKWANNPQSPALGYIVPLDNAPGWFGYEEGDVCFSVGYAPGDRLYVRESWRVGYGHDHYREDLDRCPKPSEYDPATTPVEYLADGTRNLGGRYYPSIFLPRWASRLWLAVTEVRVQRLQDITEDDAEAEGVEKLVTDGEAFYAGFPEGTHRCGFAGIWQHLHTAEGERWQDNPWIVALTFDVHHGNIDQRSTER